MADEEQGTPTPAPDTRGPKEVAYDDIIRPAMQAAIDLCQQHKVAMFACFELDDKNGFCGVGMPTGKARFAWEFLRDEHAVAAAILTGKESKGYAGAVPVQGPFGGPPMGGGALH
jgi:hypothetical protein